ncbi:MAG: hypothetical protein ACTS4Y_01920, partial [Candidatus Hodgkinia cicadicola]
SRGKTWLRGSFSCGPASGFPVIKVKATLIDGEYHEVDSSISACRTFDIFVQQVSISVPFSVVVFRASFVAHRKFYESSLKNARSLSL